MTLGVHADVAVAKKAASYAVLGVAVATVVFPFAVVVSTSFKRTVSIAQFPPEWIPADPTLDNYVMALTGYPFLVWMGNSIFVVGASVVLKVGMDCMAGYAFAKGRFAGKDLVFNVMLGTMMVPFAVTLIPTFGVVEKLGLVDTYAGLILPVLANPLGIYLMRQYFQTVPMELIDAGKVDGCSEFGAFARIVVPVSTPAILALATIHFITGWTNFLWPLVVIQSDGLQVLATGVLTMRGIWQQNWGLLSAACVLTVLPVVFLLALTHRYFLEGIRLGALK